AGPTVAERPAAAGDVRLEGLAPGPVDDAPAANDEVVHARSFPALGATRLYHTGPQPPAARRPPRGARVEWRPRWSPSSRPNPGRCAARAKARSASSAASRTRRLRPVP